MSPVKPHVGLIQYQSWQVLPLVSQVLDHGSYAQNVFCFTFCLNFLFLIKLWHASPFLLWHILLLELLLDLKSFFNHYSQYRKPYGDKMETQIPKHLKYRYMKIHKLYKLAVLWERWCSPEESGRQTLSYPIYAVQCNALVWQPWAICKWITLSSWQKVM